MTLANEALQFRESRESSIVKGWIMEVCTNCGSAVSDEFAKVFGDNDDVVHICLNCTNSGDISEGNAPHPSYK